MTYRILKPTFTFIVLAAVAYFLWPLGGPNTAAGQEAAPVVEPAGGGEFKFAPVDEITDEQRSTIQAQIKANIEMLEASGQLGAASPEVVAFSWPVKKAAGLPDFGVDGISNYVDQNLAFPNQLRDWNCGTRTYDQSNGYNHKGIDIFTWPFGWRKMDFDEVEVVAGAAGTIVFRSDGNFDRSCSFGSGNWNAVYIRHSDNSIAWYGHMKNGSVISKPVGATVAAGEKLGIVGSSGNSTGPHLHFELYNAANQLRDPFQGPCNTMNTESWWAEQEAYRMPRVNALMTQSGAPSFNTCPAQETTNQKDRFHPGEQVTTATYYRDQGMGQQTQYSLIRPDASVFQSWSHTSPNTFSASYWFWTWNLPANAPRGTWKLRASFNSTNYERSFRVGSSTPFDYDADGRSDISVYRPTDGNWHLLRSTAGYSGIHFGLSTDRIAPADYDGDGKTDVAVYRPTEGTWYITNSSNGTFSALQFGSAADLVAPGDYDGDGKADLTVFRPSTGIWYISNSRDASFTGIQFGTGGDLPTVGDFDGDGRSDIAVYRPSTGIWYRINSATGGIFAEQFGITTDKIVPADYDGDGRTDIAVYRSEQGAWYIKHSSNSSYHSAAFGIASDIPSAADYDGDGKADIAVFRPTNGHWYIANSSNATFTINHWGQAGDRPTQSAFGN